MMSRIYQALLSGGILTGFGSGSQASLSAFPPLSQSSAVDTPPAAPQKPAGDQPENAPKVSPAEYEGWRQYSVNCARCHGQDVLPNPVAANLLPARLSASACEALRACPYRFFALRLLRLRQPDELDDEVENRDFGTWLHAVLQRFHATREEPASALHEETRLRTIAREVQMEQHLDDAAFLPFAATFARIAPRYIEWLHRRDQSGARWTASEVELRARPSAWGDVEMHGIVDRIDSLSRSPTPITQLIDYKTGSAERLRNQLREPLEDTQLAFYAALLAEQADAAGDIEAIYLPLDEREALKEVEHPDVETSAARLVEGIGSELARIRAGAPLPALGEGQACVYCEARGLCRRDQWPAVEATA